MPRHERLRAGRPRTRRSRRSRYVIVTNGSVTERAYFSGLKGLLGGVSIEISRQGDGLSPKGLVKIAEKILSGDRDESSREGGDPIAGLFVVTDTDEFKDLGETQRESKRAGVHLVLSNPCFEVWLIDHVKQCPPSCVTARRCEEEAAHMGLTSPTSSRRQSVSKSKDLSPSFPISSIDDAIANAAGHNTDEKASARHNSPARTERYQVWTDMPGLISQIRPKGGRGQQEKALPRP